MEVRKVKEWYKLDNAAKIFPPTTNKYDTKTFRFAVNLKEEVNEELLNEALNITLKDFPIFLSILRKGFFWYYLEETDKKAFVSKENTIPCDYMEEDDLLFKVMYYKKRISVEVSHALTDGTGTLYFLRTIVANYLELKYDISNIKVMDTSSITEKSADSFNKYYKKIKKQNKEKKEKGYVIKGKTYPEDRTKVIEGIVSSKELLKISKSYNTTLTVYLTSILIESIGINMSLKERKKPIYITIPVNLRKYFPSYTIRNFFNTISVIYKYDDNIKFEDIIKNVDKQFKDNLKKEVLEEKMSSLAILENIFIIRLIPVFIKDLILKLGYKIARKYHTMALSNIGIVTMPEEFEKYIEYFDVFSSTDGMQVCMCSFKDNLVISFTSHFINTEIEKNFFRTLSKYVNVDINFNNVEEDDEDEEML